MKANALSLALCFVFFLAWLPFLWLSFYNVPIGMHEWEWMTDYAGRFTGSWWELQQHLYLNVMGRYTSNGLLSLTSYWCTLSSFPYFFFFWQLAWVLSILFLLRAVFRNDSWWLAIGLTFGIQVLYLFQLEDVYDSLYRFTALLTYQAGAIVGMLAAIFFIQFATDKSRSPWKLIVGFVFMVLAVGTNEISMLIILNITAVLYFYYQFITKRKSTGYLIALIIAIAASLIVVFAPGNGLRMESEHGGADIIKLIFLTLSTSAFIWLDWIGSLVFILMTMLAIPFLACFTKSSSLPVIFKDYRPWLLILLLIVPANMGLLIYSTGGNAFPERVIDHMFIHVVFVWLGFIISFAQSNHLFENVERIRSNPIARTLYVASLSVVVLHIVVKGMDIDRTNKHHSNYLSLVQSESNVLNAWLTIGRGDAAVYYQESMNEMKKLYNCFSPTCFMKKPQILPKELYDPLSDRRNRNGDGYMGYYFDPRIKVVKYIHIE